MTGISLSGTNAEVRAQVKAYMESAKNNPAQSETDGKVRQYSLDEQLFIQQINDWKINYGKKHGSYNGEYFDLGTTPDVLKKHGAPDSKIIMSEDCFLKVTGGKHAISIDELAKLPSELNDPILLFKSKYKDKKKRTQKAYVALTEMTDIHGNDVIAIVHINKYQGRMVVNKIASVYSKSDELTYQNKIISYVNSQISQGNLLDASTKKAPIWFTSRGLQLPKLVQTMINASDNSIHKNSGNVNTQNNGSRQNSFDDVPGVANGAVSTAADTADTAAGTMAETETDSAERNVPRAEPDERATKLSGRLNFVREDELETAWQLSEALGVRIMFYQGKRGENGFYSRKSGIIWLNANSSKKVSWTVAHELTHFLENTGTYAEIRSTILEELSKELRAKSSSLEAEIKAKKNSYAARGEKLTDEGAEKELVANFVANVLLTNKGEILRMVTKHRNFGERVLDFASNAISKLTGRSNIRAFFTNLTERYSDALAEANSQTAVKGTATEVRQNVTETQQNVTETVQNEPEAMQNINETVDSETEAVQPEAKEEAVPEKEAVSPAPVKAKQASKAVASKVETATAESESKKAITFDEAIREDEYLSELYDRFERGEISEEEYDEAFDEYVESNDYLSELMREKAEDGVLGEREDRQYSFEEKKEDPLKNSVAQSFNINKLSDYIHVQKQVVSTLENEGFFSDKNGNTRTAVNRKSGMIVEIRPDGIKETFNLNNYVHTSKLLKTCKLATIRHIPKIIETGNLVSTNNLNSHNPQNVNAKYAYIEREISINGTPAMVRVAIRQTPQKNKFWVHNIDIKNNAVSQPGRNSKTVSISTGNSAYDIDVTIPQNLLPVKRQFSFEDDVDNNDLYGYNGYYSQTYDENENVMWTVHNGILNDDDISRFYHNLADHAKQGFNFIEVEKGKYLYDQDEKLIITNGDFNNPIIYSVIDFSVGDIATTHIRKEFFYDKIKDEKSTSGSSFGQSCKKALRACNAYFGTGNVRERRIENYRTYGKNTGRSKRKSRQEIANENVRKIFRDIRKSERAERTGGIDSKKKQYSFDDVATDEKDLKIAELESKVAEYEQKEQDAKNKAKEYRERKKLEHREAENEKQQDRDKNIEALKKAFVIHEELKGSEPLTEEQAGSVWGQYKKAMAKATRVEYSHPLSLEEDRYVMVKQKMRTAEAVRNI